MRRQREVLHMDGDINLDTGKENNRAFGSRGRKMQLVGQRTSPIIQSVAYMQMPVSQVLPPQQPLALCDLKNVDSTLVVPKT